MAAAASDAAVGGHATSRHFSVRDEGRLDPEGGVR